MTVGEMIKNRREQMGLTQDDLAKRLGYKDRSSICKLEGSSRGLTVKVAKKLADALDIEIENLLEIKPTVAYPAEHFIDNDPQMSRLFAIAFALNPEEMTSLLNYAEFLKGGKR